MAFEKNVPFPLPSYTTLSTGCLVGPYQITQGFLVGARPIGFGSAFIEVGLLPVNNRKHISVACILSK